MVKDYDLTDVVMCKLQLERKPQDNDGNVSHCPCCRHYANERDFIKRELLRIESRIEKLIAKSGDHYHDRFYGRGLPISRDFSAI